MRRSAREATFARKVRGRRSFLKTTGLLLISSVVLFFLMTGAAFAADTPTVVSDRADYIPGGEVTLMTPDYQGIAVMNYPVADVPYTRIHEPRHLHPELEGPRDRTLIFYERSVHNPEEPYYPVNTKASQSLLRTYFEMAQKEKDVIIGGRLGGYAYHDMDKTILAALECYRELFGRARGS